eukprot:TRINITY_DN2342_c0_g1_i2.p1 TRINITY_DN2342_c0_g1~~TRINITY_DN2342_c0_g1_i2.p1  ORF type:complete len:508 (+),score=98.35 TRINITY_DN2342_c0_g1_i2:149-1672(+)
MSNELEGLKVLDLKELLSNMGLPTNGRKADLIARLEQAKGKGTDGEDNDGHPDEMSMEGTEKTVPATAMSQPEQSPAPDATQPNPVQENNGTAPAVGESEPASAEVVITEDAAPAAASEDTQAQPTEPQVRAESKFSDGPAVAPEAQAPAAAPAAEEYPEEDCKIFVGGIAWETNPEKLRSYFGKFGEIRDTTVMLDKITGNPRGFGFVTFVTPMAAQAAASDKSIEIDGRRVDTKMSISRESMRSRNERLETGPPPTRKLFMGGLAMEATEEGIKKYFSKFGEVTEVMIMTDPPTGKPRGFGFLSFDTIEAANACIAQGHHMVCGKMVECKRSEPKGGKGVGKGGKGGGKGMPGMYHAGSHGMPPYPAYGGYPPPPYGGGHYGGYPGYPPAPAAYGGGYPPHHQPAHHPPAHHQPAHHPPAHHQPAPSAHSSYGQHPPTAAHQYPQQSQQYPPAPSHYDPAPASQYLSLIHISEPTRLLSISYAVFCLKKKKKNSRPSPATVLNSN